MNFDPTNHRIECPLHGVPSCLTCHTVEGECSLGGCTRKATRRFAVITRAANPAVAYVAHLCDSPTCLLIVRQTNAGLATLNPLDY